MASYVTPKRATEYIFYVGLVSQSTGQFQVNPTIASGDWKISKDGGAFANLATLPAVTPAGGRAVKVTLSTTEMDADNVVVQGVDAAGDEWDEVIVNIQTTARQIDDLAFPTTSGRSMDVTATGEVGIDWANIGGPTTTVNLSGTTIKTATDVETDTANIQTRIPAALSGDGFIKADLLSIGDELVSGNNATLNLKALDIRHNTGTAVTAIGSIDGAYIQGLSRDGAYIQGSIDGIYTQGERDGIQAVSGTNGHGVSAYGSTGDGLYLSGTKSINAPNDVALPSGDLDDQLQAIDNFIDTEVTAIKAKTDQLTFTVANQVDANMQSINDAGVAGDGNGTPWGPA